MTIKVVVSDPKDTLSHPDLRSLFMTTREGLTFHATYSDTSEIDKDFFISYDKKTKVFDCSAWSLPLHIVDRNEDLFSILDYEGYDICFHFDLDSFLDNPIDEWDWSSITYQLNFSDKKHTPERTVINKSELIFDTYFCDTLIFDNKQKSLNNGNHY